VIQPSALKFYAHNAVLRCKNDTDVIVKRTWFADEIVPLVQLCPTQMAYWAKNYVTILTRAAH